VWSEAFGRPGRTLGVLRAARRALAGGYGPDDLRLVIRVAAAAAREPERFPERGSLRWTAEHSKAGDPDYLLRPGTLGRLIPEAEAWETPATAIREPRPEPTSPVFVGERTFPR
jgi:hypothetical protein